MMPKLWLAVLAMFRSREARAAMATAAGTILALAIAVWLLSVAVPPASGLARSMHWAVQLATALASGLAALGILGRPWSSSDGVNRMLVTLTRTWLITFVLIIGTLEGEAALRTLESVRQQRLCANAARVLNMRGPDLIQLGLRCLPAK